MSGPTPRTDLFSPFFTQSLSLLSQVTNKGPRAEKKVERHTLTMSGIVYQGLKFKLNKRREMIIYKSVLTTF